MIRFAISIALMLVLLLLPIQSYAVLRFPVVVEGSAGLHDEPAGSGVPGELLNAVYVEALFLSCEDNFLRPCRSPFSYLMEVVVVVVYFVVFQLPVRCWCNILTLWMIRLLPSDRGLPLVV